MADAIVVLNAGSSSIKFSLFAQARRRLELVARGQAEGLYTAPRFVAKDARGRRHRRESVGRRRRARPRRRARSPGRVPARSGSPSTGSSASATGSCTAGSSTRSRCASTRRCSRRSRNTFRSRRCTSRTTWRRSGCCSSALPELPQVACFDTAFHRDAAAGRAGVRAAEGDHRARRAPLRLPRPVVRVHRAACCRSTTPRAAAGKVVVLHLGNGVEHVRDRRRPQRREHDGLHRGRRPADGHALRQPRSRRGALPDGRAQDGRARDREADLPAIGPARRVGHLQRHAHARGERRAATRRPRSTSSSTGSGASWARSRRRSAASTRSCSRQASARTADRCASASAATRHGSASSSTPRPTRAAAPRISTAGKPRVRLGASRPTKS